MCVALFMVLFVQLTLTWASFHDSIAKSAPMGCARIGRCCGDSGNFYECRSIDSYVSLSEDKAINGHSVPCYCDRGCIKTNSCCSDYTEYCSASAPPRDCVLSEWSNWSKCSPIGASRPCKGVMRRRRVADQMPHNCGNECPPRLGEVEPCTLTACRVFSLLPYEAQESRDRHYSDYEKSRMTDNIRGMTLAPNMMYMTVRRESLLFSSPDCKNFVKPYFCIACDSTTSTTCGQLGKGQRTRLTTVHLDSMNLARIGLNSTQWYSCMLKGLVVRESDSPCAQPSLSSSWRRMQQTFLLM